MRNSWVWINKLIIYSCQQTIDNGDVSHGDFHDNDGVLASKHGDVYRKSLVS